jgi:hypothetical protein
MTAQRAVQLRPPRARASHVLRRARGPQRAVTGLRLIWLHAVGRRVPAALATLAACGIGLRIALIGHWDAYGALQLPLICEASCAAVVAMTMASPFGEAERVTARWLPWLRLGAGAVLTMAAIGALTTGAVGGHLAGGAVDVLRNVAGLVGIGLLCAAVLGGGLAWVGPTAYLIAGIYALYTQWHPPAITTPWLWAARPPHDLGAALCAGAVYACGLAVTTMRGARDAPGDD